MARLDPETERVVIRLVYDGPAWAGKTTTLRSLARTLGSRLTSGQEADGRTLQFDWVDYVGGLFQGLPIQCQIVGVPGQRVLERRRLAILATADAVVFVADSRASQVSENSHSFELLREALQSRLPPVATVVQANKRDLPDSLSLDDLRCALRATEAVAMTESVAETGEGVRETFVLAVRLALDRVRALWDGDGLPKLRAPIEGAAELLASMTEDRPDPATLNIPLDPPTEEIGRGSQAEIHPNSATESGFLGGLRGPRRPDSSIPPGLVWPPVHGRVIVHESARESLALVRTNRGAWTGESPHWRTSSSVDALFFDIDQGRHALVAWARWHTASGERLSNTRALVLAEAAPGAWRLWQILLRVPTMRDAWRQSAELDDRVVGERLLSLVELRIRAEREMVHSGWTDEVSLDNLAISDFGAPVYADFVHFPPDLDLQVPAREVNEEARLAHLVNIELAPALQEALRTTPDRLAGVLASLDSAATTVSRRRIASALRGAILRA